MKLKKVDVCVARSSMSLIAPEDLFYIDGIGKDWETFKSERLKEVGR